MFGFLLRLARAVLDGVLSKLTQQLNVVQDEALSPLRMIVQAVTGGVWIGKGADAFVEEISSLMIPGVGQVADQISTLSSNITFARDVIDRADEEVNQIVRSRLYDAFEFY
jgi:hypothetical protein